MKEFSGFDLVVKDPVGDQRLRSALARVFRVPETRTSIIKDIADYPEKVDADLVGVRSALKGDFLLLLSIHTEPRTLPYSEEYEVAQAMSAELESDCLLPDESENPNAMYYIPVAGSGSRVCLDDEQEEEGRYVLTKQPVK